MSATAESSRSSSQIREDTGQQPGGRSSGPLYPVDGSRSYGDEMEAPGAFGRSVNLARWDESAPLHASSSYYDLDGFREGRDDIRPFELEELGSVAGLDLVHLQCHIGTDTLSWARHGARVVGLDFSPASIDIATRLAEQCRLEAEFVCADVYDSEEALDGRTFDIVYTGVGALGWLPDIGQWAEVVAGLLRPGGAVYLVEIHPVVVGVFGDGRTLSEDIFQAEFELVSEPGGTYAAPEAELANIESYERAAAVSEVVTGLLDTGLRLDLYHEQSYTNAPWPWLERGTDGFYRLPDGWPKYPLTYSLLARRPFTQ
jgi:2-polyprenyl-3-methyl-5-hydroxy-6-metoxy-1,4-benzoquinol methylase